MSVESVDTKDIIKVGVIGMGRIGLVHLEAITKAPGVTPVIVSNPTISKAEAGTCRLNLGHVVLYTGHTQHERSMNLNPLFSL